jgi:hypothetical protein
MFGLIHSQNGFGLAGLGRYGCSGTWACARVARFGPGCQMAGLQPSNSEIKSLSGQYRLFEIRDCNAHEKSARGLAHSGTLARVTERKHSPVAFCSAPAERSGDGAFHARNVSRLTKRCRRCALPPQYKVSALCVVANNKAGTAGKMSVFAQATTRQVRST